MDCCSSPYWVYEHGISLCRHCGQTKAVYVPNYVPYVYPMSLPPWTPYPTWYGNGTVWCDTAKVTDAYKEIYNT